MSTTELKVQIFESLDGLDQLQSEQVLAYIRSILSSRHDEEDYANFKRRAMSEIKRALNHNRGPQAA
ncbi:MAG: hypothetical protein OER04_11440 [Cyclobacteriaceae bacterium]|nr:hypothetical protein [Cyclobacteriaceae bacterium]